MKTTRLVVGIISIVLFLVVAFQSCAAGIGNTLADNGEVSGSAGVLLAFAYLIAGIISVAARKSQGGAITALCFYILGRKLASYCNICGNNNFSTIINRFVTSETTIGIHAFCNQNRNFPFWIYSK